MRILMLSDCETLGGAAIAASRIADALGDLGHEVHRAVWLADGQDHSWHTHGDPVGPEVKSSDPARAEGWLADLLGELRPDVANIHNLHGAGRAGWGIGMAACCCDKVPTVWTLHDQWSFTGRCAYTRSCELFIKGCDATCPTPTEYPSALPEQIAPAWERRRDLLQRPNAPWAVAPSRWLADVARQGLWRHGKVQVIGYPTPQDLFHPMNRQQAQQELGLDSHKPVVLAMAQDLGDPRKGMPQLQAALPLIPDHRFTLLTAGKGALAPPPPGITVHALGHLDSPDEQVRAFAAADVVIHPALEDNLPNVVLEAIACGRPVLAFSTGGIPDMVKPGVSGWLVKDISPEGLARGLAQALDELANGAALETSCRELAESAFSPPRIAKRYEQLFIEASRGT